MQLYPIVLPLRIAVSEVAQPVFPLLSKSFLTDMSHLASRPQPSRAEAQLPCLDLASGILNRRPFTVIIGSFIPPAVASDLEYTSPLSSIHVECRLLHTRQSFFFTCPANSRA